MLEGPRKADAASAGARDSDSVLPPAPVWRREPPSDEQAMKTRARWNVSLSFVKIEEIEPLVSYKGSKDKNLSDFEDFPLKFRPLVYMQRNCPWRDLVESIRADIRSELLSQVTRFVKFKLGNCTRGAMRDASVRARARRLTARRRAARTLLKRPEASPQPEHASEAEREEAARAALLGSKNKARMHAGGRAGGPSAPGVLTRVACVCAGSPSARLAVWQRRQRQCERRRWGGLAALPLGCVGRGRRARRAVERRVVVIGRGRRRAGRARHPRPQHVGELSGMNVALARAEHVYIHRQ